MPPSGVKIMQQALGDMTADKSTNIYFFTQVINIEALERKSPQGFSIYHPAFLYCI